MKFCKLCILPDTRPNLVLDENGVCNACRFGKIKYESIDWDRQAEAFNALVKKMRGLKRPYDCLVPVSGGKDSTWQIVTCLKHGLHPLAVTWRTPVRTPVGQANLDNLVSLGVDHIEFQINPNVEKRFMLKTLARLGSPAVPMHMAIFNIPFAIAVKFRIPLIVWAENGTFEYGGGGDEKDSDFEGLELNQKWVSKFGVCHGTTAKDWVDESLTEQDLTAYFGPTDEEMAIAGVRSVFLGNYFKWDPNITFKVAKEHGFKAEEAGARTGLYNFADIDDDFISIHHYLKWYKFGFTRLFDNLSLDIRAGKITRDQAIDAVRKAGPQRPQRDIEKFCAFVGIDLAEFEQICEKFRSPAIWRRDTDGTWKIPGYPVPDWDWNKA